MLLRRVPVVVVVAVRVELVVAVLGVEAEVALARAREERRGGVDPLGHDHVVEREGPLDEVDLDEEVDHVVEREEARDRHVEVRAVEATEEARVLVDEEEAVLGVRVLFPRVAPFRPLARSHPRVVGAPFGGHVERAAPVGPPVDLVAVLGRGDDVPASGQVDDRRAAARAALLFAAAVWRARGPERGVPPQRRFVEAAVDDLRRPAPPVSHCPSRAGPRLALVRLVAALRHPDVLAGVQERADVVVVEGAPPRPLRRGLPVPREAVEDVYGPDGPVLAAPQKGRLADLEARRRRRAAVGDPRRDPPEVRARVRVRLQRRERGPRHGPGDAVPQRDGRAVVAGALAPVGADRRELQGEADLAAVPHVERHRRRLARPRPRKPQRDAAAAARVDGAAEDRLPPPGRAPVRAERARVARRPRPEVVVEDVDAVGERRVADLVARHLPRLARRGRPHAEVVAQPFARLRPEVEIKDARAPDGLDDRVEVAAPPRRDVREVEVAAEARRRRVVVPVVELDALEAVAARKEAVALEAVERPYVPLCDVRDEHVRADRGGDHEEREAPAGEHGQHARVVQRKVAQAALRGVLAADRARRALRVAGVADAAVAALAADARVQANPALQKLLRDLALETPLPLRLRRLGVELAQIDRLLHVHFRQRLAVLDGDAARGTGARHVVAEVAELAAAALALRRLLEALETLQKHAVVLQRPQAPHLLLERFLSRFPLLEHGLDLLRRLGLLLLLSPRAPLLGPVDVEVVAEVVVVALLGLHRRRRVERLVAVVVGHVRRRRAEPAERAPAPSLRARPAGPHETHLLPPLLLLGLPARYRSAVDSPEVQGTALCGLVLGSAR